MHPPQPAVSSFPTQVPSEPTPPHPTPPRAVLSMHTMTGQANSRLCQNTMTIASLSPCLGCEAPKGRAAPGRESSTLHTHNVHCFTAYMAPSYVLYSVPWGWNRSKGDRCLLQITVRQQGPCLQPVGTECMGVSWDLCQLFQPGPFPATSRGDGHMQGCSYPPWHCRRTEVTNYMEGRGTVPAWGCKWRPNRICFFWL